MSRVFPTVNCNGEIMLEGARRSRDEFNASEESLGKMTRGMAISRHAYPTEPRIIVACGLIDVQSNNIGRGGPAICNRRQAAREKCYK